MLIRPIVSGYKSSSCLFCLVAGLPSMEQAWIPPTNWLVETIRVMHPIYLKRKWTLILFLDRQGRTLLDSFWMITIHISYKRKLCVKSINTTRMLFSSLSVWNVSWNYFRVILSPPLLQLILVMSPQTPMDLTAWTRACPVTLKLQHVEMIY